MMEEILLPLIELEKDLSEVTLPKPQDYDYWQNRKERIFYVDYEIDEAYELMELGKTIMYLNKSEMSIPVEELKPIYIMIHSFGGDVYQAMWFADLIISSRIPIVTVALGTAMSSGFIILLGGHKRYAFKHSQLLVHEGYAAFQGTASEIEQAQENYKKQLDDMKTYVLDRTHIEEKVFNKNKKKDWYLTKDEIIKYDVAEIINTLSDIFGD